MNDKPKRKPQPPPSVNPRRQNKRKLEEEIKSKQIKKSIGKLKYTTDDDFEDEIKISPRVVDEKNKKQFYLGDPQLKAVNVKLEWTQRDIDEYQKCKDDVVYFIQNYMKIIHVDKGVVPFKMYDYQKKVIKIYEKNRFVTLKFPRQSGKTITTVGYLLHYVLFNEHKNVGILANRAKTARGILNRFRSSYRQLPFFLQSGVVEWNKGNVTLENGCVVFADATSEAASRSESISLLILDEFALVENTKAEEFMKSVYPTISSGKTTKIFVFSTPNGMNHFYKLWMDAKDKRNGYVPYEIKWDDVPGRDDKFKQETIANVGEDAWRQEFECVFEDTLITIRNKETGEIENITIGELYLRL